MDERREREGERREKRERGIPVKRYFCRNYTRKKALMLPVTHTRYPSMSSSGNGYLPEYLPELVAPGTTRTRYPPEPQDGGHPCTRQLPDPPIEGLASTRYPPDR